MLAWGASVHALAGALLGTILLGIGITDARHYLIPDEYTWGGLVIGLAASLAGGWQGFVQAVIGAAAGFGLLYIVGVGGKWMFKEEAMGGGDIKMMAMVGSFVGWKGVLLTIFSGALLGTLIFVPLSLAQEATGAVRGIPRRGCGRDLRLGRWDHRMVPSIPERRVSR